LEKWISQNAYISDAYIGKVDFPFFACNPVSEITSFFRNENGKPKMNQSK